MEAELKRLASEIESCQAELAEVYRKLGQLAAEHLTVDSTSVRHSEIELLRVYYRSGAHMIEASIRYLSERLAFLTVEVEVKRLQQLKTPEKRELDLALARFNRVFDEHRMRVHRCISTARNCETLEEVNRRTQRQTRGRGLRM